jgi:hypothetical protein
VLILLVLILIRKGKVEGNARRIGIALLGVGIVFLVANLPLLMDLGRAKLALDEELRRQMEGRYIKRVSVFHLTIFGSIWRSHDIWQWLMVGVAGIGACAVGAGKQRAVVLLAAVVALCYAVIICFSSGYAGRYGMPWSLFVSFLSATGFAFLVHGAGKLKWKGVAWILIAVFGVVTVRLQYRNGLRSVRKEFVRDSHRDVNDWLLKHADSGAKILQSKQVGLYGADRFAENEPPPYLVPSNIETKYFVCNFGSFRDLMASDVAYVGIGSKEYQRFYKAPLDRGGASDGNEEFYIELIGGDEWEQVLATPNLRVGYLHPGLYLFRRKSH